MPGWRLPLWLRSSAGVLPSPQDIPILYLLLGNSPKFPDFPSAQDHQQLFKRARQLCLWGGAAGPVLQRTRVSWNRRGHGLLLRRCLKSNEEEGAEHRPGKKEEDLVHTSGKGSKWHPGQYWLWFECSEVTPQFVPCRFGITPPPVFAGLCLVLQHRKGWQWVENLTVLWWREGTPGRNFLTCLLV